VSLPTVDQLPDPRARFAGNPHMSGHKGGHSTDLRAMAASGMTLLGRIEGVDDGDRLRLAPDLTTNLDRAAALFGERFQPVIERFIAASGEDVPPDDNHWSDFQPPVPAELDLGRAGVSTVIWTSGYRPNYGWLDFPILDEMGLPRTRRGVSEVPGLYFVGSLWQTNQVSATLFGPHVDSRHIAEAMGLSLPEEAPVGVPA
jgi:putative flavoprotein involved in K+ transport